MPGVDLSYGGFPCTTVSALNTQRSRHANRHTIQLAALATGACFWAIVNFCNCTASLTVYIGENVPGLLNYGRIEICRDAFEQIGFWFWYFKATASEFGNPQARERVWLICIRMSAMTVCPFRASQVAATTLAPCSSGQSHRGHVRLSEFKPPSR